MVNSTQQVGPSINPHSDLGQLSGYRQEEGAGKRGLQQGSRTLKDTAVLALSSNPTSTSRPSGVALLTYLLTSMSIAGLIGSLWQGPCCGG